MKAKTHCDILLLSKADTQHILQHFPEGKYADTLLGLFIQCFKIGWMFGCQFMGCRALDIAERKKFPKTFRPESLRQLEHN